MRIGEEITGAYVKNGVMNVTCCCTSPTAIISQGYCFDSKTVLPGSQTGKEGGSIQIIPVPRCAAGTVYSESAKDCVADPAVGAQNKKKKKKKKKQEQEDD
jgi:hypothetical protein